MAFNKLKPVALTHKLISPMERIEALTMASMSQERADLCAPDQQALQRFLEMNAALLLRLYQ